MGRPARHFGYVAGVPAAVTAPALADFALRRLRRQRLVTPFAGSPAALVSWLGAVQAQDFAGAKWALGQRLARATETSLDRAFDAGEVVRTHILRPTWHFVAASDLRWLQMLAAPRVRAVNAAYDRVLEIDAALIARSHRAIEQALQGGRTCTRAELQAALGRAGIAAAGQRLAYLVMRAELDLLICSGPRRGKQFTYALVDECIPAAAPVDRDAALARLTERYFASHGPATLRDFAWWSGLTMGEVRRGVAMVSPALVSIDVDGLTWWSVPGRVSLSRALQVHLVPNYDEHLIGFRDRIVVTEPARPGVWRPTVAAGGYPHQLLVNGRVAGLWRRHDARASTAVEVLPFRPLSRAEQDAVERVRQRYAAFLDRTVELAFS